MAKAAAAGRYILAYLSWPLVFFSGLTGAYFAFAGDRPMLGFAAVYAGEVLLLFLLERTIPYEQRWLQADGETANDIAHTVLTKGLVQLAALAAAIFPMLAAGLLQPLAAMQFSLWPSSWPMIFQATLAVVIAEFGLYWAHRIA